METLERVLAGHPFFEGLDPRHLTVLVGCASNVRFDDGHFLFRAGEESSHLFLLRGGMVALEIAPPGRTPLVVETLGEGDILGWPWLTAPYHRMFDARAGGPTPAFALDGECLRAKCEADHDLGYELLKRVAQIMEQRLRATRLQLLDRYGAERDAAG
jgi:CRP/FNR family transcriptional regulator, cyclic AMP receptor protein